MHPPWILRLKISPSGGFEIETREEQQVEAAADAASSEFLGDVEEDELIGVVRWVVGNEVLPYLLQPTYGPLVGAEFRLFLYDADLDRLMPALGPGSLEPSRGWPIGVGVTGAAYEREEYLLAIGPEASDTTYGLDPEQQERYKDLKAVAAMPIFNGSGVVIGLLSASTNDDAALGFTTGEGFDEHLLLAQKVARILIDLLQWFDDGHAGT